ncbi:hypothetical protein ACSSS7_007852 [Eimeria intestinalis]
MPHPPCLPWPSSDTLCVPLPGPPTPLLLHQETASPSQGGAITLLPATPHGSTSSIPPTFHIALLLLMLPYHQQRQNYPSLLTAAAAAAANETLLEQRTFETLTPHASSSSALTCCVACLAAVWSAAMWLGCLYV